MKYIKLLLIAVLISIVSVSCKEDVPAWLEPVDFAGAGDAEMFFGVVDAPAKTNTGTLLENSTVFTQIPITYYRQPYSFPFAIDIEVVNITDNLELKDVLMITETHLNFAMGPLVDKDNNPITLTNTSYLEVKPVPNYDVDKDIEIVFEIKIDEAGTGVKLLPDYKQYTLKITNTQPPQ